MKLRNTKILALMLAILIIISSLPIFVYAAQPTSYSKEYNSGTRDETCTSLSGTSASSYYTGEYAYANLITLSPNALKTNLKSLMKSTHTKTSSYNDCHYKADKTDCENGNGLVTLIYTSYQATMDQWNGWNREHVWPQSLGGGNTDGGGADLHHIRPSDQGVNSSRGNKKYGNAGSGASEKYGSDPAVGVLGGTYNSTYFEPLDNVKGDVARICLYVYVRWGSEWGADDITDVFQSVDVLLEWCEIDPVDTWEMGRNEVVQKIQGNRNVFIDYPELAWQLFGEEVPSDMVTPSGAAKNGNVAPPVEGGDNDTENETDAPVVTPTDGYEIVATPVVGTAYKFAMVQKNANKTCYLAGGMSGYYMATTTNGDAGIDVYLEATNGGYYLYTMSGTNKTYINMVVSGTHVNGAYESTASTVYRYDATSKTLISVVNGADYWFGTRNDKNYETVGPCATSYNGFVCNFYAKAGATTPDDETTTPEGGSTTPVETETRPVETEPVEPETSTTPDTPTVEDKPLATFDLGANGSASHNDGNDIGASTSFTADGYTLNITNASKVYSGARDAKGNSCLKMGTSKATGSFTFTVPSNVDKVIIYAAKYKANASKISINGESTVSLTTSCDNGEYTAIEVDTSSNKTVSIATVSGGARCMINTIEFWGDAKAPSVPDETDPEDTTPEETTPEETTPTDNELTVKEAIDLGASKDHNTYTTEKYYVTGVITEVYNTTYGNMKITDGKGNILTIYGTYSADGSDRYDAMDVKPAVGDTVTIYGIVGQYNNVPQIKNGWITEHIPAGAETESTETPSETESIETPSETESIEAPSETESIETPSEAPSESESVEIPSETESVETPSETTPKETETEEEQTTEAPKSSGGCGSSISCGAIIISALCMGLFAVVYKKKKD